MTMNFDQENRHRDGLFQRIRRGPIIAAALCLLGAAPAALAQVNKAFQWADWALPHKYSAHGGAIDSVLVLIFSITMIDPILVQASLVMIHIGFPSPSTS